MKKILLVALGMGTVYIFLLKAIANFITRDTEDYVTSLSELTAEVSKQGPTSLRKSYLQRQTLDAVIQELCDSSTPNSDSNDLDCFQNHSEADYVKQEVAKIEDMLKKDGSTNLEGSFVDKEGVVNRPQMVYDMWYKRIVISLILAREEFSSLQPQQPFFRLTKGRFADYEDISPLIFSVGIGALLITLVQKLLPSEPELGEIELTKKSKKASRVKKE